MTQPQMPPRLEDTWIRALAYPDADTALHAYETVRDYIQATPGVVAAASRAVTPEGQWLVAAVGIGARPTPQLAAAFPPGVLIDVKEALSVALRQRAVDQWATMQPGAFHEARGVHTILGDRDYGPCPECADAGAAYRQRCGRCGGTGMVRRHA